MKMAIAVLFLFTAAPAFSEDFRDACKHASEIAEAIMTARQNGATAPDVMDAALKDTPPESKKLMEAIVLDAFDVPRYRTKEPQDREISEYASKIYTRCMAAE